MTERTFTNSEGQTFTVRIICRGDREGVGNRYVHDGLPALFFYKDDPSESILNGPYVPAFLAAQSPRWSLRNCAFDQATFDQVQGWVREELSRGAISPEERAQVQVEVRQWEREFVRRLTPHNRWDDGGPTEEEVAERHGMTVEQVDAMLRGHGPGWDKIRAAWHAERVRAEEEERTKREAERTKRKANRWDRTLLRRLGW